MTVVAKNIVLTGMMGCGKTVVGQALCELLNGKFELIDTDSMIEQKYGKITDIFATWGEVYFRKLETEIVESLFKKTNLIISTGGGTFTNSRNIDLLKENGVVFYLKTDVKTILERLKFDNTRPLLQKQNKENKLLELLEQREVAYKKANYIIETDNKSIEEVALKISELYGK